MPDSLAFGGGRLGAAATALLLGARRLAPGQDGTSVAVDRAADELTCKVAVRAHLTGART